MSALKKCKRCNGKGMLFVNSEVDTGKVTRLFGIELPIYKEGKTQMTCGYCFGKGMK